MEIVGVRKINMASAVNKINTLDHKSVQKTDVSNPSTLELLR